MAHTYIITEAYVLGDNGYVNGTVDGTAVSVTCPTLQFQSLPTAAYEAGSRAVAHAGCSSACAPGCPCFARHL
jgi:hypothetical protein